MQDQIEAFEELGVTLVGIAPDAPEGMAKMVAERGLTFPVLIDADNEVTNAFGILNEANGKVPHPTVALIDAAGTVRWLHLDEDYTQRPSPETLLAAVRALSGDAEEAASDR